MRYVTFCCRGYVIEGVQVDGVSSSWSVVNSTLFHSPQSALGDVRDIRCVELCWDDEADCQWSGNVWVKIPKRVKEGMKEREKAKRSAHDDIDITGDSKTEEDRPVPIVVSVSFRISPECRGLEWWREGGGGGVRGKGAKGEDVCLTITSLGDASLWMPCMDAPSERGSYEVDLIVPAHLQAVASGRLKERRYEDDLSTRVRFTFVQERPIPSRCMGWAVGRFMLDFDDRLDWASCFFPASAHAAFTYTITQPSTLSNIVRWFEPYLDVFPYPYLHLVFCSTRSPQVYAGLLLLPVDWLTEATHIDPVYVHRRHLAHQLAMCWMTALVTESPSDDWISVGISGLLQLLFVEHTLGHSEAEYLALMWSCEVVREDGEDGTVSGTSKLLTETVCPLPVAHGLLSDERTLESKPLCWNGTTHPSESLTRINRRKAAVVMRMLQAKTGQDAFQQITHRLMEEHSEHAITAASDSSGGAEAEEGGAVTMPISTQGFSDLVKEVSADVDLSSFFSQWLLCDGYPLLQLYFDYNPKKKNTVVEVEQVQCKANKGLRFEGSMKCVIHESERVTEQERRVEQAKHEIEFSCVSRVRRNRKRKHYDRETLLHLPLEKLLTRHNDTPVLWVRCDVLHAFFQPIDAVANEVMICSQLQGEKEVRGQLEAICALWRLFLQPDGSADVDDNRWAQLRVESVEAEGLHLGVSALKDAFNDSRFFYRVRLLAARVLARSSAADASDSSSRQVLEEWMRGQWCDSESGEWKANDFSSVNDYLLKKGLALELSRVYITVTDPPLSPGRVVRLLISLVSENDNEKNLYSDDHYLASLLLALGNLRLAETETQTRATIVGLLQRHLSHDQVLPSYQRVVTQAALTAGVVLQLAHGIHEPLLPYSDFLDSLYPAAVRVTAFRCVLLLCNDTRHHAQMLPHLLAVFSERDAYVQEMQLQCWCALIGEKHLSIQWLRSSTSSAAVQVSDALWAALLATSSSPYGWLPGCRFWLLRLYQLCFGRKLSAVTTAVQKGLSVAMQTAIGKAVEAREEERVGEGGGVEWRSTTARRATAQRERTGLQVRRLSTMDGSGVRAGKLRVTKPKGSSDYKVKDALVVETAEDEDEEWRGRD